MTDPLVVLVLLAHGGQPDPMGPALSLAAGQALGEHAQVLIEQPPELPAVEGAETLGARVRAEAVVEVEWLDPGHEHVVVRVHQARDAAWREQTIAFRAGDPPEECGRTIGFAVASLIEPADRPATADGAPPTPGPPGPPVSPDGPPSRAERSRVRVDVKALATVGSGATSTTGGGELTGRFEILRSLSLVVTGDARAGEVPVAAASFVGIEVGGGGALMLVARPRFELGACAQVMAQDLIVRRAGITQSAWQPEGRLSLEAAWFPALPYLGLVATVGAEASFGAASLSVADWTVASVFPVRAVGALGARARF